MRSHPSPHPSVLASASASASASALRPGPATLAASVLTLCLLASAPLGAVPPLADPTQPPGYAPAADMSATTVATRLAVQAQRTPLPRQLQAVQTSARGVATALIDARVVRVGDVLGDGPGAVTVQAIDADGVTLRGPQYQQRLALTPGGTKTPSAATAEIVITRSRASTGAIPGDPAGATPLAPPAPRPALRPSEVTKEFP